MASSQAHAAMEDYWQDDFTPLEAAGKAVLAALREDEAAPDADLYRRIVSSGSGSHLYYFPPDRTDPTLSHRQTVPLPPYLAQQLRTTRVSSLMGLLPEAELTWMSVDEKLFLWSSNASTTPGGAEDFCSFTVPTGQCVVSVGLVRPKKGVFKDVVDWCLVVATPEEVILCALARSVAQSDASHGGNGFVHGQGTLRLIPTRYILPTDSIPILSVCGTPDGRIFLGGYDGCLYEMTYDSPVDHPQAPPSLEKRMDAFYDGATPLPSSPGDWDNSVTQTLTNFGKRAISAVIPSSSDPARLPRKCRKLNRSTHASSMASAVVPSFVVKAASSVLGGGQTTAGGPIVKVVLDSERSCMYALSSRGWISAFYLSPPNVQPAEIKLMAVVDTERTARLYLEAVSRGRMYPPTSSHSSSIGNITFPGGGSSAQAGVGGMDGARTILKLADSGAKRNETGRRRPQHSQSAGILTPVSIDVIPRRESGRLTLMAITEGGLRYYLSTLSTNVLNSGPGRATSGTSRNTNPLAPSRKFTLCHVRSPPPIGENGTVQGVPSFDADSNGGVEGYAPSIGARVKQIPHVDTGYYGDGIMVLALEHNAAPSGSSNGGSNASFIGDVIVASAPDCVARKKPPPPNNLSSGQQPQQQQQALSAPGGISEAVALPLVTSTTSTNDLAPVLPGGRVLDIASHSSKSSVLTLTLNSQTPTDSELKVGLISAYIPPSRVQSQGTKSQGNDNLHSSLDAAKASASSGAVVVANQGGSGSVALTIISNFLLSRPLRQGLVIQRPLSQLEAAGASQKITRPLYRLSNRYGYAGFSTTAADGGSSGRSVTKSGSKSTRLGQWLLHPAVAPLNSFAVQHLVPSVEMVALNSGGMNFFRYKSVLFILAEALMSASVNVGNDEAITKFFISYGFAEGCAMCLSLAVGCGPAGGSGGYNEELRNRARRAALSRGRVPKLLMKEAPQTDAAGARDMSTSDTNTLIPPGYEFHPSSLCEGLTALISRLLRPVWFKPAVVVTEGPTIQPKNGNPKTFPAKVELLLDDPTLDEVRRPLLALQVLMREVFDRAVLCVPGSRRQDIERMDVDDELFGSGQNPVTSAMLYHGYIREQNGAASRFTPRDAEAMARLIEERNVHSLFRLVSRSVQLLNLLSLLKRAQSMPELFGVDWGLLHGLTVAQLVQRRNCQDRIERLLSSLVSSAGSSPVSNVSPTAESDELAKLFTSECYLYFSPGSYYAYMGFRAANEALSCAPSSARHAALTNQAAEYLKRAAHHWYSAPLISGRILHGQENESYEEIAQRAMRYDSPLAKAAAVLFQLENVVGVVDVCLTVASNFGGRPQAPHSPGEVGSAEISPDMLPWERVLYHKRPQLHDGDRASASTPSTSRSSATVVGADVTPKDALSTCYAILFHYLSTLLDSPNAEFARKMIDACATSTDKAFLHALYDHLIRTNHVGALLQISSSDLEKWLARPDMDVELIWQYYREQGQDAKAGEVMRKQACEENPDLPIDVRINMLRKARSSYTIALQKIVEGGRSYEGWSRPMVSDADRNALQSMHTDVSETLDVAVLQSRVLGIIASSSLASNLDEEQMSRLKSTLIPVSDLYNEYAAPLNLSDMCLLILHSCRHNDSATTETLWRNILCEEIFPCATRSAVAYQFLQSLIAGSVIEERVVLLAEGGTTSLPLFEDGDWVLPLRDRVISLGREVYGSGADYVFPVDFLASVLEGLRLALLSSRQGLELGPSLSRMGRPWPLQVLVDVGVPFLVCFEAYENMSQREERELMGGIEAQRKLLHINSTVELLSEWVEAVNTGARGDVRENVEWKELTRAVSSGVLMSRIDYFKAALEGLSDPAHEDDAQYVLERLSRVENDIRRIA